MKSFEEMKVDFKVKMMEIRLETERKAREISHWASENKELAIALIPFGIAFIKCAAGTVDSIERKKELKEEKDRQERYVYDPSRGMYIKLRRPMRHSEILEYDRRLEAGETRVQILSSMGLLD